ncbi:Thiamine thiazole synthase [subsurface metagenome]
MQRRIFLNRLLLSSGAVMLGSQCRRSGQEGKSPEQDVGFQTAANPVAGTIKEPERDIPVVETADVLVIGGGPSGVAAAIAASRTGARTILAERYNHLGGLWTGGLVLPLLSTHAINKQSNMTRTLHGIGGEILQRLQEIGMAIRDINPVVDPEATKYVLEVMLKESGVMPLYHCWASNVIVESNTIKAVLLETKSGRVAISPKTVIDCTGDGDIIHLAGEEYDTMNYELGLVHRLGNTDRINKDAAGYKDLNIGGETPIPSVNWVNMVGGDYEDALDFRRLSELQQQHRIEIWEGVQQIRSVPGYEEVFLLDTAAQQGVRMSRILKGEYRLTLEDSMTFKSFDDNIGISGAWTSLLYQSRRVPMKERPMWQIPYRALLPQKTKNLLVAGRCFSFEQGLFQDARIIGTCLVTGHGAGVGAALASDSGNSVQELDVKEIQKVLLEQKVFLG